MSRLALQFALFLALTASSVAGASEEFFDRLDAALTTSAHDGYFRARVSGTLDVEGYRLPVPVPALIESTQRDLYNPRLTVFLDGQVGAATYFFAQARADRGFDPGDPGSHRRLDEYALRFTPWRDGRLSVQAGKFATVVGNWVNRHLSWDNPLINAPLPYENLTGMWDTEGVRSLNQLLQWSHVRPGLTAANLANEKQISIPVLWGPAYATGLAVSGALGKFRYSTEIKNAPLSSRPRSWTRAGKWWTYPALAARLGYMPNAMWNLGVSASTGTYLRPSAGPTIAAGFGRGDYRQEDLAADASFAWRHWQVWAEVFRTRFTIPRIGDADTVAAYVETKYKFTPQLFGAVRWNRQMFATLPDGPRAPVHWGRDTWRIDVAPGYRFTPHIQMKLQYSLQHVAGAVPARGETWATQLTVRF